MSTQQLTREEIARVFAMHWGCMCISYNGLSIVPVEATLMYNMKHDGDDIGERKLLLTPLNRISTEHLHQIAIMYGGKFCHVLDNFLQVVGEDNMVIKYFILTSDGLPSHLVDILRSWGYETKLFFAPNHWANGKTAIELGIAIDNLQTK